MGFSIRFKEMIVIKRKSYRGVITKRNFKKIFIKCEDIKNYVDRCKVDDLNEFFGYVEKTLELNDLTRLMNMSGM